MKTAKQWASRIEGDKATPWEKLVKEIQVDALKHAASLIDPWSHAVAFGRVIDEAKALQQRVDYADAVTPAPAAPTPAAIMCERKDSPAPKPPPVRPIGIGKFNESGTCLCARCESELFRSEKHSAYYCLECNVWCEEECGDPDCEACCDRPDVPVNFV